MANKRKFTTALVAGVTAAALLLGGTFAWTSISQQAKNETAGVVNVGGRLHDDFNGTNKDVYVENFTDPKNGGQPIYARVRLDEYMEVGSDAGQADKTDRKATPVVAGTDINDVKTWKPHVPSESCAVCATEGTCKIHDHWTWTMGGDNGTTGQTTFMPTFNKDKDSLAADINGTYAGTNADDKIYYDDYVEYTTDNTAEGVGVDIAEAEVEAYDGKIYSVIGTELYDDDTDALDNNGTRQVANVTHTAKQTATGSVVLMKDWDGTAGNYWVYDTDGWAYWANPIMPGQATGLLLDGIQMTTNPGEKCYYAINVVAQFSTVNDWENFYTDENSKEYDVSTEAQAVLKAAAANVTTVTVTNTGATVLSTVVDEEAGTTNTTTFTATATKVGATAATAAESEFTWEVFDADLNPVDTSDIAVDENGVATLTVGENEKNANLIIAATHTASGAVGLSAVTINNPVVIYRLAVSSNSTDEYTPYEDIGYLNLDSSYTVTLTENDKPLAISEVVGVEIVANYSDSYDELNAFAGSATLQDDGTVLLTVSTQDAEFGTGSYVNSRWKIIKLTVKDSEGSEYSRCLHVNTTGMGFSDIIFRYMDGSLASVIGDYYNTHDLAIDTMYTFEPGLYTQSMGTWNEHLDTIWFDDSYTVTAYKEDDEGNTTEATSVTIKDNTIIFAETGEYVIEAETTVDGYETAVRANVTVYEKFELTPYDDYNVNLLSDPTSTYIIARYLGQETSDNTKFTATVNVDGTEEPVGVRRETDTETGWFIALDFDGEKLKPNQQYNVTVTYKDGDVTETATIQITTILPTITLTTGESTEATPITAGEYATIVLSDGTNIADLLVGPYTETDCADKIFQDLQTLINPTVAEGYSITWSSRSYNAGTCYYDMEIKQNGAYVANITVDVKVDENYDVTSVALRTWSEIEVTFTVTNGDATYTGTAKFGA